MHAGHDEKSDEIKKHTSITLLMKPKVNKAIALYQHYHKNMISCESVSFSIHGVTK